MDKKEVEKNYLPNHRSQPHNISISNPQSELDFFAINSDKKTITKNNEQNKKISGDGIKKLFKPFISTK